VQFSCPKNFFRIWLKTVGFRHTQRQQPRTPNPVPDQKSLLTGTYRAAFTILDEKSPECLTQYDVSLIRAVFFDLDGTLYERDAAMLRMAEEQFRSVWRGVGRRQTCLH
jgi:hypothetical protein